jgi:putative heme-binding domain-containing protein
MLVTYFNTQKVVRTRLIPDGSTFRATEHDLLTIKDPNVHLTDVIEDADGSLLVIDTGGWFRIGCPASIAERPDLRGAIYRLRKKDQKPVADAFGRQIPWGSLTHPELAHLATDPRWKVREKSRALLNAGKPPALVTPAQLLDASCPRERLRACSQISESLQLTSALRAALLQMLEEPLDPALEHAAMHAAMVTAAFDLTTLRAATVPRAQRRLLIILEQSTQDEAVRDGLLDFANRYVDADDPELARSAVLVVSRHLRAIERSYDDFAARLAAPKVAQGSLHVIAEVIASHLAKPQAQQLLTLMLRHDAPEVSRAAWKVLSRQPRALINPDWLAPLEQSLAEARGPDLPLLLDAISKLDTLRFDPTLLAIVNDTQQPQPIRLKALAARLRLNEPLGDGAFALLLELSQRSGSPTARVEAARLLGRSRLSQQQLQALAPVLATAGPVELGELLKLGRRMEPETGPIWAANLARSPVFSTLPESAIKTAFSSVPAAIYEQTLAPSMRAAADANDAKRRRLEALAADAGRGRVAEGRRIYENSSCVACHKFGGLGRAVGPDLSLIGRIRSERDLLESILFPDATLARDFETHVIETAAGESLVGMIKSDGPESLVLLDLAGHETTIPHVQIIGRSTTSASLMPPGLEQAFTGQELLDLIAYLASLD